ncbi:histidine utilization repressor [Alteromonas mediterranea MED64]|uniref:UTRA domain-containing protein n=1 Tax=Alteromonas mediterranea TaxID=314275 RepID=UPI0003554C6C|nr:UTRA domain-containing protein [Alteromonas mediterranea]AGP80814.1 histidine utilization repressor [Alteromonas mediterranea MED64]
MQPRYMLIKTAILDAIERGEMKPGSQVPSENQLAQQHNVSRMTARRALSEMVDDGILMRSQGIGTFVSDHRPMSSMLEIKSIRDEIEQRGHRYTNEILVLEIAPASADIAHRLAVDEGVEVYHSIIVHCENNLPVQYEDRWVNPAWIGDYLNKDFKAHTANYYLNQVAPLSQADHSVEAVIVEKDIANALLIKSKDPCLKITRRTFSRGANSTAQPKVMNENNYGNSGAVVSHAVLYHPGSRYRLGGHLEF